MKRSVIILLFVLIPHIYAQTLTGKVISIKDGDTIEILIDKTTVTIRLHGIDSPEKEQAYGQKAKQFTSDLCYMKDVTVLVKDKDRYGRTVGIVTLPDGKILNNEIVKAGFAWHYKQYSDDETLASLERSAKINQLGLWADINPTPPWEYRNGNKTNNTSSTPTPSVRVDNTRNGRCQAITKKGTQCKRNAQAGSNYCWQHN